MSQSPIAIDIASVQEAESLCRRQLRDTPDDLVSRLRLAWFLLLHASHEAGAESVLTRLAELREQSGEALPDRTRSGPDPSADRLMGDCLRQLLIVAQLSLSPAERADAQTLKELVQTCSGEQVVRLAEQHATEAQRQLLAAIFAEPAGEDDPSRQ